MTSLDKSHDDDVREEASIVLQTAYRQYRRRCSQVEGESGPSSGRKEEELERIRQQIREEEQSKANAAAAAALAARERELEVQRQELAAFLRSNSESKSSGNRDRRVASSEAKRDAMMRILALGSKLDALQASITERSRETVEYLAKAKEQKRQERQRHCIVAQSIARWALAQRVVRSQAASIRWRLLTGYANSRYRDHCARRIQRFFNATIAKLRAAEIAERKRLAAEARRQKAAVVVQAIARSLGCAKATHQRGLRSLSQRIARAQALFRGAFARRETTFLRRERNNLLAVRMDNASTLIARAWKRAYYRRKMEKEWARRETEHMMRKPTFAASVIQATYRMHFYGHSYREQWRRNLAEKKAAARRQAEQKRRAEEVLTATKKIQHMYREHLARRQLVYRRRVALQRRVDYLLHQTRTYAALRLQRFNRIVLAHRAVRLRKEEVAELMALKAWRRQQELQFEKEMAEFRLVNNAAIVLQKTGRGLSLRRELRLQRIRQVVEWEKYCEAQRHTEELMQQHSVEQPSTASRADKGVQSADDEALLDQEQQYAIVNIQRMFRGHHTRKTVASRLQHRRLEAARVLNEEAATTVQKAWQRSRSRSRSPRRPAI